MSEGSVIVDMAADSGGNCELSEPGEDVLVDGVTVVGLTNPPSSMPTHASFLYARNIANFLGLLVKDGELAPDFDDEIVAGTCVVRAGTVVHGPTAEALGLTAAARRSADATSRPDGPHRRAVRSRRRSHEHRDPRVPHRLRPGRLRRATRSSRGCRASCTRPLMSGSNAIHGIVLVGTILIMGEAHGAAQITLGFFAVLLATLNIVGGFVVTDRMLEMFKAKPRQRATEATVTAPTAPTTVPTDGATVTPQHLASTSSTWSPPSASSSPSRV